MSIKTPARRWHAGSFWDNLAAASDAVGFENFDVAVGIAQVKWDSIGDREDFLDSLTLPRTRDLGRG
jgi:hypothetical protein|tara:strand:- start:103 stop:303 length:201 start_codon:yes stop_codon:yes gene_type:complete